MATSSIVQELEPARTCSRCVKLDVATLLPWRIALHCHIIFRSELNPQTCTVCEFLVQCLPILPLDEVDISTLELGFKSWFYLLYGGGPTARALPFPEDEESADTEVSGSRYIVWKYRYKPEWPSSVIVSIPSDRWSGVTPTSAKINYEMIMEWFKKDGGLQHSISARVTIPPLGIRLAVIDCTNRSLVPLPTGALYFALSYVWGKDASDGKTTSFSTRMPQTIEDSISVCKALDCRYLWIDRYCITHNDERVRALQIKRMNEIYSNAFVVLIACAGIDPHYGLPGVSRTRPSSPGLNMGNRGYLQMVPTVDDIASSIWSTRAWTYQEAFLATRRLYFTDRQLYFESSVCVESEFTTLAPVLNPSTGARMYSPIRSSQSLGNIFFLIETYSRRNMSFPGDVLNALSGVLAFYEQNARIRHLWGLPFSKHAPASIAKGSKEAVLSIETSLLWALPNHQSWRREGFPSWSWAGWHGAIEYRTVFDCPLQNNALETLEQGAMNIQVELESGTSVSWDEFQGRYAELKENHHKDNARNDNLSRYILVEADTSAVTWCSACTKPLTNHWAVSLKSVEGGSLWFHGAGAGDTRGINSIQYDRHPTRLTCECWGLQNPYMVVHLSYAAYAPNAPGTSPFDYALLLHYVGGHWERLALILDKDGQMKRLKKVRRKIRLG